MSSPAVEKVRSVIQRVTYKPGWTFFVSEPIPREINGKPCYSDVVFIHIGMVLQNAKDGGKTQLNLTASKPILVEVIDAMSEEAILGRIVLNLLRECEEHELREWFKVDGNCVIEPHPERNVPNSIK